MGILATILLVCAAGALAFFYLGVWSTVRHTSLPIPTLADEAAYPPISLLKPIKGTEEALEQNLRSFFEQDYPAPFELVFASCEDGDPGIAPPAPPTQIRPFGSPFGFACISAMTASSVVPLASWPRIR